MQPGYTSIGRALWNDGLLNEETGCGRAPAIEPALEEATGKNPSTVAMPMGVLLRARYVAAVRRSWVPG